jgi:glycosyltransferase involved in cell wall biosynthesis
MRLYSKEKYFHLHSMDKLARIESSVEFLMLNFEFQLQNSSLKLLKSDLESARLTKKFQNAFSKKSPLVSVIIPASRSLEIVERATESVLGQSYENLEILLVCDRKREDIIQWLKKKRNKKIKVLQNNSYPDFAEIEPYRMWAQAGGSSRNLGMQKSQGEFTTFVDDDDEMLPNKIEACVTTAQENAIELVGHFQGKLNSKGKLEKFRANKVNKTQKYLSGSKDSLGLNTNSIFMHRWFNRILWPSYNYQSLRGIDKSYIAMLFLLEPRFKFIDEILVIRN